MGKSVISFFVTSKKAFSILPIVLHASRVRVFQGEISSSGCVEIIQHFSSDVATPSESEDEVKVKVEG